MSRLTTRLITWYRQHGRILPWRGHPDPYAVWVSEIMLQQTRVEAVIPYFERWMRRFPTIKDLARRSNADAVAHGKVVFICVPTPPTPGGGADLSFIEAVARDIATSLKEYRLIVEKS